MGFRGGLKQGGGFWNNVDGTITGYEFTTTPPGAGKGKKATDEWIYFVPSVRVDGAEEDTNQHLFLGASERYEISDDGQTLTSIEGSVTSIGARTPAGKFLDSLIEHGFPESNLPDLEGGEPLNLEAIIGTRVRLQQIKDVEGTAKRGKRKDAKTGKEYDRTDSVVSQVYDLPKAGKQASAGKPAVATKGVKNGKPNGLDRELLAKADKVVLDLIEAAVDKKNKTGEIPISKLSVGTLRLLSGDSDKEAVRKLVNSEEYRVAASARGAFQYDSEAETVSIEA